MSDAYLSLLSNISLLLAMVYIYSSIRPVIKQTSPHRSLIIKGIIFGGFGALSMVMPVVVEPGVRFDGRNVMVALAGAFGGPLAAISSAAILIPVRLVVGGIGAWPAIGSIVLTAWLSAWFYNRYQAHYKIGHLLLLGLLVALQGSAWALIFLPQEQALHTLRIAILPTILLYSTGSALIGSLLQRQIQHDETEIALRESEARFRDMTDAIHDLLWLRDAETGQILYLSPAFERIWGRPRAELERDASRFPTYIHPEDRERIMAQRARQTEGDQTFEYRIVRPDGTIRWVRTRTIPVQDRSSGRQRIVGVSSDITEQRLAQDKLQQFAHQLEISNQELQAFVYMASHDLQEPLRKVQTFADRLLTNHQQALNEQGRDYLQRMNSAATRMQALIEDLLSYSRVASQGQPFQPVDLNQAVSEVLSDLDMSIEHSHAQIDVQSLLVIDADPFQIRQLLQNLIANALKFRHPQRPPVVTIAGEMLSGGEAKADREALYELRISDNGIGFDPIYAEQIFGLFQRLHGRSEYSGTGIGLAICRKITARHGGSISAIGRPGEGATFIVHLPVHQAEVMNSPVNEVIPASRFIDSAVPTKPTEPHLNAVE